MMKTETLSCCALDVLTTSNPVLKAEKTREYVRHWRAGDIQDIGQIDLPDRPARPEKPELRSPKDMPKRRKAGTKGNKIALLHALAHIELNAIDLAWDIMARFSYFYEAEGFSLPKAFFDDWCKVADDEAKHFLLLQGRLQSLDASYGDLPAHDGLWEASLQTAEDFAARLAVVPMVLEARGLDVTPGMIKMMQDQGDLETAAIFQTIHDDEITHVRAGTVWFESWCDYHGLDIEEEWQNKVRTYFHGKLKKPFNDPSREKAGMIKDWYYSLAEAVEK